MLRGLIVRQGFMVAQALMGVLLILIAIGAMRDLMAEPMDLSGSGDSNLDVAVPVELKNPVDAKIQYASIIKSNLFGDAGKYKHNFKKPPPPPPGPKDRGIVEPTKLPLVLKGTLDAGLTSPFSSATIELKKDGQKSFFIGDEVMNNVYLREVRKNEVLLENMNPKPPQMEILKHELSFLGTNGKLAANKGSTSNPNGAQLASSPVKVQDSVSRRGNTTMVPLNRKDIVEKLERDYERLASSDVIVKTDENGKQIGLSTPDIESIPVAKELGFKNGDILTSINNEPVKSAEQVASLANKYQNAAVVRIGFLRDGQQMTTMYRLR